mmetsp:Transcript_102553/g.141818  ORF Transcript_102553/g.141818 Transcript_102553/m.141818 type:complete len:335 (-) Transcript_102553:40-1044(-)
MAGLLELFNIQILRIIIISDLKLTAKALNTARTSSSKLLSEDFHQLLLRSIHWWGIVLLLGLRVTTLKLRFVTETTLGSASLIFVGPTFFGNSLTIKVPGGIHHSSEVVIAINRCTNVVVILLPFVSGDNVIGSVVISQTMSSLKGFKEFLKNLLFGLLTRFNIRVEFGIVSVLNIIVIKVAIAILVHDSKSFLNESLSISVHGSTNIAKEFIVLNKTRVIIVHIVKERLDLTLGETEHVILHGFGKLVFVKGHRVVVIHNTELLSKTNNTSGTARGKLLAELFKESFRTLPLSLGRLSTTDVTSENLRCKLMIVQGTATVFIVNVEKSFKILL